MSTAPVSTFSAPSLFTDRLELVPLTPDFLRASLEEDHAEIQRLAAFTVPPEWPDCRPVLELRLAQLEENPALLPWLLRAMVIRETREMAGCIGFHTAPGPEYLNDLSPGAVEPGFLVFPEFRRRGFAREAVLGLMDWAAREHGVPGFVVSIRPDNLPSQALAAQLGFRRIGGHVDEIDGPEDILHLPAAAIPREWPNA